MAVNVIMSEHIILELVKSVSNSFEYSEIIYTKYHYLSLLVQDAKLIFARKIKKK